MSFKVYLRICWKNSSEFRFFVDFYKTLFCQDELIVKINFSN